MRINPKKELAERLFTEQGMSQKEVAEFIDVSEKTVSQWAIKDNWRERRAMISLSPDRLIREYYYQSEVITNQARKGERPLTSGESDALGKIAAAIEKLDKKVSPSIVAGVFMRFNSELKNKNLDLFKLLKPYQSEYLAGLYTPDAIV